jgi:hypothetical protein
MCSVSIMHFLTFFYYIKVTVFNFSRSIEPMQIDDNSDLIELPESKISEQEANGLEVPLKQRLRSSSRSQNTNVDDDE